LHFQALSAIKHQYQTVFRHHQQQLFQKLQQMGQAYKCVCNPSFFETPLSPVASSGVASSGTHASEGSLMTELVIFPSDWFRQVSHTGCRHYHWQQQVIRFIEEDVAENLVKHLDGIRQYQKSFNCHQCGMCCKMASSDVSYETMQQQAECGDAFAQQFISVFLPYPSREAACKIAPDVVAATLAEVGDSLDGSLDNSLDNASDKGVHFYYCPYLSEDNRCSLFGNPKRPAICGSYPETPLSALYQNCAWQPWKQQTHGSTLEAHSMLALCESLLNQLKALSPSGRVEVVGEKHYNEGIL
jgi:Fe-S-cluster containining protein